MPRTPAPTPEEAIDTLRWMQNACTNSGDQDTADFLSEEIDKKLDQINQNHT